MDGLRIEPGILATPWVSLLLFPPRRPPPAVSYIYHSRVGCWALVGPPAERPPPPEPHWALRGGKLGELRIRDFIDSCAILLFVLLRRPSTADSSIYHFRFGRWAWMATPGECPPRLRGTLRGGKMNELQTESGILGVPGPSFCFCFLRLPSTVVSSISHGILKKAIGRLG